MLCQVCILHSCCGKEVAELQQAEVMCQEVTWPIGGRVGAGPDGMYAYVLMCEFTYVFSHAGVGSSVNEYIWRPEVCPSHRSSGTIYLVILR